MLYQATATPFKAAKERKGGNTCGILSEVKDERVRTKPRAVPVCFQVHTYLYLIVKETVTGTKRSEYLRMF